jgi:hypothetical protein
MTFTADTDYGHAARRHRHRDRPPDEQALRAGSSAKDYAGCLGVAFSGEGDRMNKLFVVLLAGTFVLASASVLAE